MLVSPKQSQMENALSRAKAGSVLTKEDRESQLLKQLNLTKNTSRQKEDDVQRNSSQELVWTLRPTTQLLKFQKHQMSVKGQRVGRNRLSQSIAG